MEASLGCHVTGAARFAADIGDSATLACGIMKRLGRLPPDAVNLNEQVNDFVARWLDENLSDLVIHPTEDLSVETWLSEAPYPQKRKDELYKVYLETRHLPLSKVMGVRIFGKNETFQETKHSRVICSRNDKFKVRLGPLIHAIEKRVFSLPFFIKKVPVRERPRYIQERVHVPGREYMATDFTSFESHFTQQVMNTFENKMYMYVMGNHPEAHNLNCMLRALTRVNKLSNPGLGVSASVEATRMSGEMTTSIGNGFTNLMLFLYLAEQNGCTDVRAVVEGDDGLFSVDGRLPTVEQYRDLGFTIKMETHPNIEDAAFCGLLFDPLDLSIIRDPVKVLLTFGWTDARYAMAGDKKMLALLRSKALSLYYECDGCPILSALARYGLRMTRSVCTGALLRTTVALDQFRRNLLIEAIDMTSIHGLHFKQIGIGSRLLMERKFGVSVATQLRVEEYLDSLDAITPIGGPVLTLVESSTFFDNWSRQVVVRRHVLGYPFGHLRSSNFVPETADMPLFSMPGIGLAP